MNKTSWAKLIGTHRQKCEQILALSKNVRYAGVFNEYGRTVAGKIRPGIKPIFSPNGVRDEFFSIASTMRLRQKSSKELGELQYILINHKKINILLFSKNNLTYYITISSNDIPSRTFIDKIKNLIVNV